MTEERTRLQNIILLILAAMILLFGVLNVVSLFRKGVVFEETLLRIQTEADHTTYYGTVYGDEVSVTIRPAESQVEYIVENRTHDVYTVEYPKGLIPTEYGSVSGIRILKNDQILFAGGYDPQQEFMRWFDENGKWDPGVHFSYGTSGGKSAPEALTKWDVMRFLEGPEPVHRGSIGLYLLMVLMTLLLMLDVAYPLVLFRLEHCCDVRDPEPSDFYLAMQKVVWVIYPFLLLAGYIFALTILP